MTGTQLRPLADLAKKANRLFHLAETHAENAVQYAIGCGNELATIKHRLEHGQWLPWLDRHFDGSPRKAQAYMQLAKAQSSADLPDSINKGLRALAAANTPEPVRDEPRLSTPAVRNLLRGLNTTDFEPVIDMPVAGDVDERVTRLETQLQDCLDAFRGSHDLIPESGIGERLDAARKARTHLNTFISDPA